MQDEDSLEWKFADMKYKAFRIHPSILMEHTVDDPSNCEEFTLE